MRTFKRPRRVKSAERLRSPSCTSESRILVMRADGSIRVSPASAALASPVTRSLNGASLTRSAPCKAFRERSVVDLGQRVGEEPLGLRRVGERVEAELEVGHAQRRARRR